MKPGDLTTLYQRSPLGFSTRACCSRLSFLNVCNVVPCSSFGGRSKLSFIKISTQSIKHIRFHQPHGHHPSRDQTEVASTINTHRDPNTFEVWSQQNVMAKIVTADLCDSHPQQVEAGDICPFEPIFRCSTGKHKSFCGQVATIKLYEDNLLVHQVLEEDGGGRVLLIDGGGSLRRAIVGSYLAEKAVSKGWSGIIVNGCIRDVEEIDEIDIGVRAVATSPLKPYKKGEGEKNGRVFVAGVFVKPGDWCYADRDGIIISKEKLS